jgi:hypothetical protein
VDIEREKRVIKLFEEALDWPAAARTQRLTDLLSGEPEILHAVLAMIAADHSSALLPTIPPEPAELGTDTPMPERIGNYRIVEEIGRGGMGLVYRAARDDGLFDQQVAIKVIRRTHFFCHHPRTVRQRTAHPCAVASSAHRALAGWRG